VSPPRTSPVAVLDAVLAATGRAGTLDAALDELLSALTGGLGFDAGALFLFNGHGAPPAATHVVGLADEGAARLLTAVAAEGRPEDLANDPRSRFVTRTDGSPEQRRALNGYQAVAAVPLMSDGRALGLLVVAACSGRSIGEAERRVLAAAGHQAGGLIARRRAEEALRMSEASFRGLFDSVTEAIYIQDRDGRFLDVNRAAEEMYGCSREYLRGRSPLDVSAPGRNDLEAVAKMVELAFAGHPQEFEFWGRRISGEEFPKHVRLHKGTYEGRDAVIAMALDVTDRHRAEEEVISGARRLRTALEETVAAMGMVVEMRDPYTAGHERRVTKLAVALASKLGLQEAIAEGLRIASDVHDIGKIAVPASILSKPGRLSDSEFEIVKTHPQVGYDILKPIRFEWPVAVAVLGHHERLDGSGYPGGLSGTDIGTESRILSVADVVEAMASHRPYREAQGMDAALYEVSRARGVLYDPDVVDACLAVVREDGFAFSP
jgi:PAS domain S-box-containing protein